MLCPKCSKEMVAGTSTFMGMTGMIPMICNFTSNEEKNKGFFKRNSVSKTMVQGVECEAYRCEDCDIYVPIIK